MKPSRAAALQAQAAQEQTDRVAALDASLQELHAKIDSLIGFLVPAEPAKDEKAKK